MKKEIADLWIKALRSGDYQQTEGCLRDDIGHCCLGVLCDLSPIPIPRHERAITVEDDPDRKTPYYYESTTEGSDGFISGCLTYEVRNWAGMSSDLGSLHMIEGNLPHDSLAMMNDQGNSFEEIADVIETYWEKL